MKQPSPSSKSVPEDRRSDDLRDAFLTILGAMVSRNGLLSADPGHYQAACGNALELAKAALVVLERERATQAVDLQQDGGL